MRVRDVMSSPVYSCTTHDTLNRVAATMWDHAVGLVPVLDDSGAVVAVITDRDIAMAAFLTGRRLSQIRVTSSMSPLVHTCQPGESLRAVQARMAGAHIRRLPVVDDSGQLVGIVSVDDLIRAAASGWRMLASAELVGALGAVTYTASHDDSPNPAPAPGEPAEEAGEDGLLERWQGAMQQLQTRRDEMRVQLRLAGMDARDEWARLEDRLSVLQSTLANAEKRAEVSIQGAVRDLSEGYRALQASVSGAAEE